MTNTIKGVQELDATRKRIEQQNGFARVTRSQTRQLQQWNSVQTRSKTKAARETTKTRNDWAYHY
jgi:hypothetical protein